jgi:hypothetical protein
LISRLLAIQNIGGGKMDKFWKSRGTSVLLLLLLSVFFAACVGQPSIESQTWIDFPLEGKEISEGKPIDIVSHFYAREGVNEVSILINGVELSKGPPFSPGETFIEHRQAWTPDEPGLYTIEVAQYRPDDSISSQAQVNVTVLGKVAQVETEEEAPVEEPPEQEEAPPEQPQVEEPAPEEPPAEEPPPEQPPEEEEPPADTSPPTISNLAASQSSIVEGPCTPKTVLVTVSVSDPSGVSEVKLYHRVVKGGQNGTWLTPNMNTIGGDNYQLTIGPQQFMKSLNPYGGSTWQFYVKAVDGAGNTGQSGNGNVQIQVCVQ